MWTELLMPRGSELYSPVCQALLRAARMGQVNRPLPPPEEEKEPGEEEDADGDLDIGFTTFKWSQVPKEMEEPEIEFLAKRRKGLPSAYGGAVASLGNGPQMRKTKVRKVDGEGNASVWDVLAPEGAFVEGEIVEGDEIMTEAPAPGTVVEGVGIANAEGIVIAGDQVMPTPSRRRPPPPKRKPKGPGRGRKKNKPTAANGSTEDATIVNQDGLIAEVSVLGSEGDKLGGDASRKVGSEDVEMGDDSILQDGEEGSDDDEDEDGEDGEDGESVDREEGELSPTPDADALGLVSGSPAKPVPTIVEPAVTGSPVIANLPAIQERMNRDPSSSPDVPLAAGQLLQRPVLSSHEPPKQQADVSTVPEVNKMESIESMTVEEPTNLAPEYMHIPPDHNPLDSLGEPKVAPDTEPLRFSDGEEDLLGSLERHLNEKR